MRKNINLLLLLLILSTLRLFGQETKVEVSAERKSDNSVEIKYSKNDPGTLTFQIKFNNLSNSSPTGSNFQAKGYGGNLLTLRPTNKDQSISYSYNYRFIRGKLNPKVNFEFIYGFPLSENVDVRVSEAGYLNAKYFGNKEPEDWKSYYFHTKNEENVLAARKGLVVEVVDGQEDIGENVSFTSKNNKVIVEQEDGTLATYGVLKSGSIVVKVGDVVFPKDVIAKNSKRSDNLYSFSFNIIYLKVADLFINEGMNVANTQSYYGFLTPKFLVNAGTQTLENNSTYQGVWNEEIIVKEMSKKELKKYTGK